MSEGNGVSRRDSLGQMSHSDLVELVLEQERIFEEAAQQWKAEAVRYREALERIRDFAIAEGGEDADLDANEGLVLDIARAALGDEQG